MVIVRESPNAKEPKDQPQWPPRSPHEALLSSPSGRKRLQRVRDGRSTSPSPRRPTRASPKQAMSIPSSESEEDEDEETLQLKLKAIEARLKLKKLQKAKKGATRSLEGGDGDSRAASSVGNRSGRSSALEPPESFKPELQVPLSPVRNQMQPVEPKSPARTLLGIDKGLKARDVSLKRPKSTRPDASLSRSSSVRAAKDEPKIKSFSERIAESRLNAQEQQTKEERIQESRSSGFGLQTTQGDIFSDPRPTSQVDNRAKTSTGAEPASSLRHSARPLLYQSNSLRERVRPNTQSTSKLDQDAKGADSIRVSRPASAFRSHTPSSDTLQLSSDADSTEPTTILESYSGTYLRRRHIDHTTLTRTLQGKELYPIPRLLHEIKGPHYDPPDCESDFVVFGVICSKSTPRDHKSNPKSINTAGQEEFARPKFMVFRLTDFKYEIDLFLFDTGFERWWKLKEGTLVAVLNPGVMPPRQKDTGAFSLKVTSSEDTVLEIGQARDLGFCKSMKADGNQCTSWVDKRKTEVCEYHISLQVDKARADRMQFSTMTGGPGAGRGGGGRGSRGGRSSGFNSGTEQRGGRYRQNFGGLAKEGKYHDSYLHETMWITPKEMGLNTANLLDKEFTDQMMDKESKRRRQRDKEKEEELAKSLGLKGNGTGSEYLMHRSSLKEIKDRRATTIASSQSTGSTRDTALSSNGTLEPPDAASLGLLGKSAQQVSLAPVKRKLNSSTGSLGSAPMGWGGAFKRGLLEKPEPTGSEDVTQKRILFSPRKSSMKQTQDDTSPRKKARLLLEGKGVRVPGRESLGATPGDVFLEDDDDDLEIV